MSILSFVVGQVLDLGFTLTPPGAVAAAGATPAFAVDDPAVATLDASGVPVKVTLIAPGTFNVTFTDGSAVAASAGPITVTAPTATGATIQVTLDPASPAA